jgi:excisionase family DNA binding protein
MTTKLIPGEAVTVNTASEEIGIHHATLYRWIQAGKVAYIQFGGILFVPTTEVERLKNEKNKKATEVVNPQ